MTAAVAHIVEEIEVLTTGEKLELRRQILDRVPWSEDLADEDYATLAAESFRALDEEEAGGA
jgi:hypothetical protein